MDEYAGGTGDGERTKVTRTTFRLYSKTIALDMMMRHLGEYHDKVEHSGTVLLLAERMQAAEKRLMAGDIEIEAEEDE